MAVNVSGTDAPHMTQGRVTRRFRLPVAGDPAPATRHLARICGWAAVLGLGGMAVALRAFVSLIYDERAWYLPTLVVIGLVGLVSTIGAFASIHHRRLPMRLLGIASGALLLALVVASL
jgi:hypothetical protein